MAPQAMDSDDTLYGPLKEDPAKRGWPWRTLLVVALLLAMGVGAWIGRVPLSQAVVDAVWPRLGLTQPAPTVTEIHWLGATLTGITVADTAGIEALSITLDPTTLPALLGLEREDAARPIRAIAISGARLDGVWRDGAVDLGDLPAVLDTLGALVAPAEGDTAPAAMDMGVDWRPRLARLEDTRVTIVLPDGPATLDLSARVETDGDALVISTDALLSAPGGGPDNGGVLTATVSVDPTQPERATGVGAISLDIDGLSLPGVATGARVTGLAELTSTEGVVTLTSADGLGVDIAALPIAAAIPGLPEDSGVAGPWRVRLGGLESPTIATIGAHRERGVTATMTDATITAASVGRPGDTTARPAARAVLNGAATWWPNARPWAASLDAEIDLTDWPLPHVGALEGATLSAALRASPRGATIATNGPMDAAVRPDPDPDSPLAPLLTALDHQAGQTLAVSTTGPATLSLWPDAGRLGLDGVEVRTATAAAMITARAFGAIALGAGSGDTMLSEASAQFTNLTIGGAQLSGDVAADGPLDQFGGAFIGGLTLQALPGDIGRLVEPLETRGTFAVSLGERIGATVKSVTIGAGAVRLASGHVIALTAPTRVTGEPASPLDITWTPEAGITGVIDAVLDNATVTVRGEGAPPISAAFDGGRIKADLPLRDRAPTFFLGGGRLLVADTVVERVTVTVDGALDTPDIGVTGAIARLPGESNDPGAANPIRPLALDASLRLTAPDAPFQATVKDARGATLLTAAGVARPGRGEARATISVPETRVGPGGLAVSWLHEAVAALNLAPAGVVSADGAVTFLDGRLGTAIDLRVQDGTFSRGPITARGVNGVVRLTELWPLATPPGQRVTIDTVDMGLPLTNVTALFSLDPTGALDLETATASMIGGQLDIAPTRLPLDMSAGVLDIAVRDIDIAQAAALTTLDGLAVTGVLTGRVPIRLDRGRAVIDGAALAATGAGSLRYAPAAGPGGLDAAGESMALALAALENFQYSALGLRLNGDTEGDVTLGLSITGSNPDLYDGYPVEFNLEVSGDLPAIIRGGRAVTDVPGVLRQQGLE